MKIYLAGRFSMKDKIAQLADELEKHGIQITTKWWQIEQTQAIDRSCEESQSVGEKELNGVMLADAVVAIIDDKDYAYRGTLTELGIAIGNYRAMSKSIKKSVFLITGKDFSNKNCGILCVPHIYLGTICNAIENSDILSIVPTILTLLEQ
jgi:nucleoside 2-deoxyribosyltransferase